MPCPRPRQCPGVGTSSCRNLGQDGTPRLARASKSGIKAGTVSPRYRIKHGHHRTWRLEEETEVVRLPRPGDHPQWTSYFQFLSLRLSEDSCRPPTCNRGSCVFCSLHIIDHIIDLQNRHSHWVGSVQSSDSSSSFCQNSFRFLAN